MIELANIKDITVSGKDVFQLYIDEKLVWERGNPHPSPEPEPPTPPPPTLPTKLLLEDYTWDFEYAIKASFSDYQYIEGRYLWSDGNNLFYSYNNYQFVLDETTPTPTWRIKYWSKDFLSMKPFGCYVWSDGTNLYYSGGNVHFKLVDGDWVRISFNYNDVNGEYVWSDGVNIYYSFYDTYKFVDGQWEQVSEWNSVRLDGSKIWSDGSNCYFSNFNKYTPDFSNFKLVDGQWERIVEWERLGLDGNCIFTDGTNIYHSSNWYGPYNKRILNKETGIWDDIPMVDALGNNVEVYGENVFYWNGRLYHCNGGVQTITPIY